MKLNIYMTVLFGAVVSMSVAQTATQNYVETVTFLNREGTDSIITIQYFDGLGQLDQTVTGGANTNGLYLHTRTEYDGLGRETVIWSPVVGGRTPDYMSAEEFVSQSLAAYDGDNKAFSKVQYDGLNRKTFTSTPGEAWQDSGKRQIYRTNGNKEVRQYTMDDLQGNRYYEESVLSCTESVDEDGHRMAVFTDFLGNKVLERRWLESDSCDTYYVYNDLGQLTYVLPPMYHANPTSENLDLYAFRYTYDDHGRIETKKLPGCEPIHYEYDKADRVIRMQDGLMKTQKKYRAYTYDKFDRLLTQKIFKEDGTYEYDEVVNFYDNYDYLTDPKYADMVPPNHVDYTDLTPLDTLKGYGLLTGVLQRASNGEYMLMSYSYDDYGRVVLTKEIGLDKHLAAMGYSYNFVGDLDYDACDLYRYDKSVNALNDNSLYSWTKHFFHSSNNKLPYRSVIHLTHKGSTKQTNDEIKKLSYDDFGHTIFNDRKGTAGDMSFAYANLHGWLTRLTSASGFEQTLLREAGADNPCWNGSIAAMEWKCSNDIKRRYDFEYDGLNRLKEARYSSYQVDGSRTKAGNTPTMQLIPGDWRKGDYSVNYDYDKNSNLREAERQGWAYVDADGNDVYDTVDDVMVTYDGNQRKSVTSNTAPEEDYYGKMTFVDGADKGVEYAYDGNGNLIRDDNKGITKIEYDLLGNPRKVTLTGQRSIEYVYAADGRKLRAVHSYRKKVKEGKVILRKLVKTKTDYINNYIFKDDKPEMFRFDGGYYSFDAEGKMDGCHLYVQDYQGNNRMVVNANTDSIEQINHYYPYGALMGDISTQPEKQNFKYSGKELDRTYGLDLYDFHARQYDPLLPGFNAVDPLAEKYYWLSPYSYCMGNPVNCIDPDGMDTQVIVQGNNITVSTNMVFYGQYVTKETIATVKASLEKSWGAIKSFEYNGKSYNVNWKFNISKNTVKPLDKDKINYLEYNPGKNNCNLYEPSFIKSDKQHGTIFNLSHVEHEFGHLIGCSDKYEYTEDRQSKPLPGFEGDIMAEPAGEGKATEKTIAPILNKILDLHNGSFINQVKDFLGVPTIYNVNKEHFSEPHTDTHKENKPK